VSEQLLRLEIGEEEIAAVHGVRSPTILVHPAVCTGQPEERACPTR
jgi:hypothetical protein